MMQSFFEWMQGLSFSAWMLEETWASPIIQCASGPAFRSTPA